MLPRTPQRLIFLLIQNGDESRPYGGCNAGSTVAKIRRATTIARLADEITRSRVGRRRHVRNRTRGRIGEAILISRAREKATETEAALPSWD